MTTRHTTKILEGCIQLALLSALVSGKIIENFHQSSSSSRLSKNNNQYPAGRDQITNFDHAQTYSSQPLQQEVNWSKELKTEDEWNRSNNDYWTNYDGNYYEATAKQDWDSKPVKEEDTEMQETQQPIAQALVMQPQPSFYNVNTDLSSSASNIDLGKWGSGSALTLQPIQVKPWTSLTNTGYQGQWSSGEALKTESKNGEWEKLINDLTKKIMEETKLHSGNDHSSIKPVASSSSISSISTPHGWDNVFSQPLKNPASWNPKGTSIDLTHLGNIGKATEGLSSQYHTIQPEDFKFSGSSSGTSSYSLGSAAAKPVEHHHEHVQEVKVPVPQPYMVPVPVPQPFKVPIFKVVPKEVEKKVPITVEKLVPKYIEKPYKVEVEIHHPKHVIKKYPVHVPMTIVKKAPPKRSPPKKQLRLRKKTVHWY